MVEGLSYFAYADHLGNVSAWTTSTGALVANSLAYEVTKSL
jgi:hypothetical protein